MKKTKTNKLSRFIAGLLIPVILGVQILNAPITSAQSNKIVHNEPTEVTSIIAVLVEEKLLEDNNTYDGLLNEYASDLEGNTIRDRVYRFARDAQLAQPFTRSVILRVPKKQTPLEISQALETLYYNGDGEGDKKSQLNGVIVIGDVPLPVVNKNGYRFVSLFPYTDFEEKTYIYNARTNEFEKNPDVLFPRTEVWHGIINPSETGSNMKQTLAGYFDKNHLFHTGHPDFIESGTPEMMACPSAWLDCYKFNRKLLFADLFWEHELIDTAAFPRYENYTKYLEDVSYMRFTKSLLKELAGDDDDLDEETKAMLDTVPDVQTRTIILSYAMKYYQLLDNYIKKSNDLVKGIGRYNEYDLPSSIISFKDLHAQEYLRKVNDAVEKRIDEVVEELHSPIPIIESADLTGLITFEDNTTANIQPYTFTNYIQKTYNDPHLGVRDVTYFNGIPGPELESAQECTIFRGSNSTEDTVGQVIELNRVYNLETVDASVDNTGYDNCYGINAGNSERCFPEMVDKPIYDINGTRVRDDIPDSALTYAGCYDFREETRFNQYMAEVVNYNAALSAAATEEDKDAIPLPGEKHEAAQDIILYANPNISFEDILDLYGGFDGIDNDDDGDTDESDEFSLSNNIDGEDWYSVGSKLLANQKTHFVIENPPFEDVAKIDLYVTQTPESKWYPADANNPVPYVGTAEIPSIVYHKEPTLETIQHQLEVGYIDSMPADSPRYVAFQDQQDDFQKIIYPNTFKSTSGEDFKQQLADLEQRLINMPGSSSSIIEEGDLTEVIEEEENLYEDIEENVLLYTSEDMVGESINWINFSTDQKHAYAIKAYVDRDSNAYIGDDDSSYEYLYFNADGKANEIHFSVNEEGGITETDEEFLNPESALGEESEEEEDDGEDGTGEGGVPFLLWLPYLVEYLDGLAELTNATGFTASCGSDEAPSHVAADTDGDGLPNVDDDGNGIPNGAEDTSALLITFEDPNNQIATGSTEVYDVTVHAVDSSGQPVETDAFTEITLDIVQSETEPKANIYGENTTHLLNGQGTFSIIPTPNAGDFSLIAHSLNRPTTIVSNTLELISEDRHVRILTYHTEIVEPPSYIEETLKNYILKDENGNEIAEIDANTGKIIIKDEAYDVEAFESLPNKPMRIGIIEIQTGNIAASVVIIPEETGTPEIHDSSYSFEDNALQLEGVHIKNVSNNPYITLHTPVTVDDSPTDAYMLISSGLYSERLARFTPDGKVFLADEHFIRIKNQENTAEPYIFVVENAQGASLAEFTIGYGQGNLQIQEETEQLEGFNNIASLLRGIALKVAPTAFAQSSLNDDSDSDGLTDIEELFIGSNRMIPDSDSDGYTDGEELDEGYDPLVKDAQLFTDLSIGHPAYDAFSRLLLRGIVTRTDGNNIRPDDFINREEFVQMVLGITCTNCSSFSEETKRIVDEAYNVNPFPDADISDTYLYCVEEAKNQGVVSGYAAGVDTGYFKPDYQISRGEAVKVILEAAGIDSSEYADPNKPWYYRYALKAQEEKIFPEQTNEALFAVTYASPEDFRTWADNQLQVANNLFEQWMNAAVTRADFALMVQNVTESFDCYSQDADGDGLPDNLEIYQYNTDVGNVDTDHGGLDDLSEVLQGKDPLDPADDLINDSDRDGMTDEWEDKYELDKFDPADAYYDSDIDGLINLHEFEYETNPRNPDTDGGGVQDGDEVWLQETDPLFTNDDIGPFNLTTGLYAIGYGIERDIVFETIIDGEAEEVRVYTDTMPADGESSLFATAEIIDGDGHIMTTDSSTIVEFIIKPSSTTDADIEQSKVRANRGVAITQVASTVKAGLVDISARLTGNQLPIEEHQVFIEPLEPAEIIITPESPVIRTGGLSKTPLQIILYDKHGNITNNDFFEITVDTEGPGKLDISVDTNPDVDGVQLQSYEGIFNVDLYSIDEEGEITVTASMNQETIDFESEDLSTRTLSISSQVTVSTMDDISIEITADKESLVADGQDRIALRAKAVDDSGDTIIGFNQPIVFKGSNSTTGAFAENSIKKLIDGDSRIAYISSTSIGPLEITATAPGVDPGNLVIPVIAGDAYEIRLSASEEKFDSGSNNIYIDAHVYDTNGNFVDYENTIPITFRITDATQKNGRIIGNDIVTTENGTTQIKIAGKNISGPVNIVASANGLVSGTISLNAITKVRGEDLAGTYPEVLYATMLGGPFGDTQTDEYAAGELLFTGKTQAVTSTTTHPKPPKPLVHVKSNGGIDILDDAIATAKFTAANGNFVPNRVLIQNPDLQETLAEVYFVYPQGMSLINQEDEFNDILQEGIFVQQNTADELYEFKQTENYISITFDGIEAVTVRDTGNIQIHDNLFDVSLAEEESPFLAVTVTRGEEDVADIIFAQNIKGDVQIMENDFEYQVGYPYEPGVYVKPLSTAANYEINPAYSGSSTHLAKGAEIVDTDLEIPQDQSPGFAYDSFGKAFDKQGIGLDGDNKHGLFFAAGNNVGVSNKPYSSEIGINLGDPTIYIKNEVLAGNSGFTQDIGTPIYYGEETVNEVLLADYNSDSLTDVLLAYESGEVRLLQNQLSAEQFNDKGLLLNIANGIYSAAAADFNNDGYDDILVATKESCVGDEICVDIYENYEGTFTRNNLELELDDKLSEVKVGDMNNDDYVDIVVSDFSGNVLIFYNESGVINPDGQKVENLGIRMTKSDLKHEVLINYKGMPEENDVPLDEDSTSSDDDFDYKYLDLPIGSASKNQFLSASERAKLKELGADNEDFATMESVMFIYMDKDPVFGDSNSKKQGVDINGSTLTLDDTVVYTITLSNQSTEDINNIMVSDLLPDTLELSPESIACVNCEDDIDIIETGLSLRPFVFGNIDIPAGESRHITYEVTVQSAPKVSIDLSKKFDQPFTQDEYLDISANPEGNNSGKHMFFYSVERDEETGRMSYVKYIADADDSDSLEPPDIAIPPDNDNDGFPDDAPQELKDISEELNEGDIDGDGIPNAWDEVSGSIDNAQDKVADILKLLSCSGGTGGIPMPINFALFAPGPINVMGIAVGNDPGLPVFGWGAPSTIPTWPPTPYQSTMGGRIYISPTLTGKVASSVCLGPYMGGMCWSVVLPDIPGGGGGSGDSGVTAQPNYCDAISESITNSMLRAESYVTSPYSNMMLLNGQGLTSSNVNAESDISQIIRSETGGLTGSSSLGNYGVKASVQTNVKIPGIVNFISGWFAKQQEEITTKLSDLPDLYVVYPNPKSFVNPMPPEPEFKNFTDVLTYINKLPIVDLESRSILIKIPAITQKEIVKMQTELNQWVVAAKAEIARAKKVWKCDQASGPQDICNKITLSADGLVQKVEENIKMLEEYKKLPKKLLAWRNVHTKYIYQIICYLDTVVQYTGGYIKKQELRVKDWVKMITQIKKSLQSWTAGIKLMVDYMKGCDSCKTDRGGLLQLLLQFMLPLPEPPVIPFPKWPDFYFDFSNIQVGLKLIWPDVRFKAEPVIFPTLPRFSLPDVPNISLVDSLNDVEIPTLPALPELPELPDLPPLPLPTLPDIPKPPEIPNLLPSLDTTLGALSKVVKILCLIKKGFAPVNEAYLKTHIETLTARPLTESFPFDTMFKFQSPTISIPFVEKIKVTTKIDFSIETSQIYDAANNVAETWNSIGTNIVESANDGLQQLEEVGQSVSAPDIEIDSINLDLSSYVQSTFVADYNEMLAIIQEEATKQEELVASIPDSYHLVAQQTFIDSHHPDLNKSLKDIQANIANEDLPELVADSNIATLRNALLAYAEEDREVTNILEQNSNYDQVTYLANNYPSLDKRVLDGMLASTKPVTPKSQKSVQELKDIFENKLLAINTDVVSEAVIDSKTATNPPLGQYIKGLYVYDAEQGLNERILVYEGELDFEHHGVFLDIDEDDDEDIIYSYGGNVYLKENYSNPKSSDYLKYSAKNPDVYNLSEFIPFSPSVNGFNTSYDSGTQTDFGWIPDYSTQSAGYEIIYKESRQDFDNPNSTPSHKINIFEKPSTITTIGRIKNDVEITAVTGTFTVNGETSSLYTFGDTIGTGNESDTEVVITFSDSSQIVMGPDTEITLPDYIPGNFELTVHQGEPVFKSNFFINLFLQEGSTVITEDSTALLEYKNGDTVLLDPNTVFFGSFVETGYAHVESVNGDAVITALPRTIVTTSTPKIAISKGLLLHTMEDSTIVITPEEGSKQIIKLSKNIAVPISQNYANDLDMKLSSGKIEIIDPNSERVANIPLEEGMLVQFDDTIYMNSGQATIQFAHGTNTYLSTGDSLLLKELVDPENPFLTLDTDIANYYSQIYTFDSEGNRSNPSEIELFAPQLCSDKEVPFAEAGPSNRTVIIYQELELNASKSFDTSGDITAYYIDTDPEEDTDGDDDPANDRDIINDEWTNPVFKLGPYVEVGTKNIALNVVDESGNIGKQHIEIEIIIPDITINKSSDHETEIIGEIDPPAESIPLHLIRNRSGMISQLISEDADEDGQYFTDEDGEFIITGLEYDDTLLLRNSDGDIVAEIDDITGRIVIVDDRYYVDVLEATPPSLPTRMVVKEKASEQILLTVLMIPDLNTDVTIDTPDIVYTLETVADFEGVHIKDRNESDDFEINPLPASDPNFTGGVEIRDIEQDTRISIVDSGGNIYFFNENLDLRLKTSQTPEEPIIIETLYESEVINEIYIAVNNGRLAEITTRDALNMPSEIAKISDQDNDGMPDWFEFMHGYDAYNAGDAIKDDDGDGLSNIEEYRLGTDPKNNDSDGDSFTDGEEVAFGKDPTSKASSPFVDVPIDHPYYDNIINLSQRNILRGTIYENELYFYPDASIDRKDFTDIILKMLCIIPRPEAYEEPALFNDTPFNEAVAEGNNYYYPVIKEAVLQGFITGYIGETDPVTGLSPFKPDAAISRAEAAKIVLEALEQQKIITLKDVQENEGEAWYVPYIEISKDLTPTLIKESAVKQTYILTEEEAQDPNAMVSRAEFVAIADRVLEAFDCYQVDDDGDGIPSVWELQNGLDPFDASDGDEDWDKEGLLNIDEYRFGTDPRNPDTDEGGTNDKIEVDRGTNPVNYPPDDLLVDIQDIDPTAKDPRSGLEEGIYIVEEACNSCPCISAIDHKADLIPGDTFFTVISEVDMSTIFAKSNELNFKGLNNQ